VFVLGIDPGLSRCGYGVIERRGRRPVAIAAGVIVTDRQRPSPNGSRTSSARSQP
jgi:Holliday junction resolvasome RuvABC endonuclease subunit